MKSKLLFLFVAVAMFAPRVHADRVEWEFTATVGGPVSPEGVQVALDLPRELHMRNTGGSDGPRGPGSGSGLCVWTSLNHAAYWSNIELLFKLQDYAKQRPGGGYPAKVDKYMVDIAKEKGVPTPRYVQIESRDPSLLRAAIRSGRMVSTTYCYSPSGRYGGQRIAHMVTLLHLDATRACVLDNNFPGTYEWMTADEYLRCATGGSGNFWAVVFAAPGPPPPPRN